MKTTVLRAAGAGGVRAADPTIGASVQSKVYIDASRELLVWNRSTVEARFDFEPNDGWTVRPTSLVLQPDEQSHVEVLGLGTDGGVVGITVRSTAPAPTTGDVNVIAFDSHVFLVTPFDPWPIARGVLLALLALVVVLALLRRLRPWEWRVTRVAR